MFGFDMLAGFLEFVCTSESDNVNNSEAKEGGDGGVK